jgi:hypothetical protein
MAQETVSGGRSFEMPEHCRFCRMAVIEKREPTEVVVNDKMQKNYRYMLTEPEGKNFHPDFKPELTPIQMLAMGVFEGKYMTDCWEEFPEEWFEHAILSPEKSNPLYNYFGVKSRLSLSEWRRRGWIVGPDVRGWFQWYCRYYYGRRLPEADEIQIKRWRSFRRHLAQVEKNCMPLDVACRTRQRQALLQWAYNPVI